ncbi:MAG: copper resistance CopC family protein [Actinomycetes bacterium]
MNLLSIFGRGLAVTALAAGAIAAATTSASAHAGIESSTPANGAQLSAAPKAVALTFAEHIKLNGKGTRLIDGSGNTVPAKVTAKGTKVVFVPNAKLPKGRYAAAWHLISVDGDPVEGAISFTVASPSAKGKPVSIATVPKVPTTISAAAPGSRTIVFDSKASAGDVEWTSAAIPEVINWEAEGNGSKVSATGVLPTNGEWSFTATLTKGNLVTVVKGKVTLSG